MKNKQLPDKASVIRFLLENEGRVMVCLDATKKGVDVPRRFGSDSALMLVLNVNMPQPIHILPDSVASELRFGGIPHYCVIPYTALWSVFNPDTNHGVLWPDSLPEGMEGSGHMMPLSFDALPMEEQAPLGFEPEAAHAVATPPPLQSVPHQESPFLQVIDGGGSQVAASSAPRVDSGSRRSHLRLVE